jgi:Uncharacterized conserved protein (DUF2163)/Phage conserved hypothetical protein BR0599
MKTQISSALQTFLDTQCISGTGGAYRVIDLFTISLLGGEVLNLASWANPVVYNGVTYAAAQGYVDRSTIKQALKCEVSQIKLTIRATPAMTLPGSSMPILQAVQLGLFAEAYVVVQRLFAPLTDPLDTSLGTVNWFTGNIAEIEELDRAHVTFTAKDPTALLSSQHPRNQFQTACRHTLFDPGCALTPASILTNGLAALATGAVLTGATTTIIPTNLSTASYPIEVAAPISTPSITHSGGQSGVNNPSATYYVVVTYTGPGGESLGSPEAGPFNISGDGQAGTTNELLRVTPPSNPGYTDAGWNLYVGLGQGDEQLQNGAPYTDFSTPILVGFPPYQGPPPPYLPTSGWFALGQIIFTSGACKGLTRLISGHASGTGGGVLTVLPPLPVAPAAGDTFSALPGDDRTIASCGGKFNNLAMFGGTPYVPLPEMSV